MLEHTEIELARRSDARLMATLSRDVIEIGLGWNYTEPKILRALANPAINVITARRAGRVLGFGIMAYGETTAHLVLLGVRPARQRQGLGRQLTAWLERSAVVAGIARVVVECRADQPPALAFYQRLSYRKIGRLRGYYRGQIDAIRLRKNLRGEH